MDSLTRSFFLGFIKIHILHHAAEEPVYGLWFIEEMEHHGYRIGPGTLYPIFHSLEEEGLLRSQRQVVNGKIRKYYRTTSKGSAALREAKTKAQQLLNEIIDE
jgi:PadR family transcriptional regulator PadR